MKPWSRRQSATSSTTRALTSKEGSAERRKALAGGQLGQWRTYIETRFSELPEELQLNERIRHSMQSIYQVYRSRKEGKVEGKHLLDFLEQYVKIHGFQAPIDPEILLKQIHPFHGHLSRLDRFLAFEELIRMFQIFLVATFEKIQGQTLLASEVCAFGYWSSQDTQGQGHLGLQEFAKLMRTFKIEVGDWEGFAKEFAFMLEHNKGSFLWDKEGRVEASNTIPFDVFRHIYLERNF